jgi:hypothetical protein
MGYENILLKRLIKWNFMVLFIATIDAIIGWPLATAHLIMNFIYFPVLVTIIIVAQELDKN